MDQMGRASAVRRPESGGGQGQFGNGHGRLGPQALPTLPSWSPPHLFNTGGGGQVIDMPVKFLLGGFVALDPGRKTTQRAAEIKVMGWREVENP